MWLSRWRVCLPCRRPGLYPWVGKIPWKRERLPTPLDWPGEFHGLYSPWGLKEPDTTERLNFQFQAKGGIQDTVVINYNQHKHRGKQVVQGSNPDSTTFRLSKLWSFPMGQLLAWGGQRTGVSASASVLPMNTQDWISLQSKGLSRVFSNTTVQKHQFFRAQLSSQSSSHIHTWPLEKP